MCASCFNFLVLDRANSRGLEWNFVLHCGLFAGDGKERIHVAAHYDIQPWKIGRRSVTFRLVWSARVSGGLGIQNLLILPSIG